MFDIGGSELLVIGVVALIVVGPKDLPGMFHSLGRFTAKARSMAREFSRAMEDAAKESGMADVKKDLNSLKGLTSAKSLGLDKMKDAVGKFEAWDPLKKTAPTVKEPTTKSVAAATSEPGPATKALATERAETKARIEAASARRATDRKASEAAKVAVDDAPPKRASKPKTTNTRTANTKAASTGTTSKPARKPVSKAPAKTAVPKPAAAKAITQASPRKATPKKSGS